MKTKDRAPLKTRGELGFFGDGGGVGVGSYSTSDIRRVTVQ